MTILTQLLPILIALFASNTITANPFLNQLIGESLYADLLRRCHNHLLVKLANELDFGPIETACASYRHANGPGTQNYYPVAVLVLPGVGKGIPGCNPNPVSARQSQYA